VDIELGNNGAAKGKLSSIVKDYPASNVKATAEGLAAAIAR
jgi:hypothetical protein